MSTVEETNKQIFQDIPQACRHCGRYLFRSNEINEKHMEKCAERALAKTYRRRRKPKSSERVTCPCGKLLKTKAGARIHKRFYCKFNEKREKRRNNDKTEPQEETIAYICPIYLCLEKFTDIKLRDEHYQFCEIVHPRCDKCRRRFALIYVDEHSRKCNGQSTSAEDIICISDE